MQETQTPRDHSVESWTVTELGMVIRSRSTMIRSRALLALDPLGVTLFVSL